MNSKILNKLKKHSVVFGIAVLLLPLLSGCNEDDTSITKEDTTTLPVNSGYAVIATDLFGSGGATTVISVDQPRAVINDISPTHSDLETVTYGKDIFRIERSHDNIAKFNIEKPGEAVWQYTTLGAGETGIANVHDIVVESNTRAYLIRNGQPKAWIVDPSATSQADFKVGELDLAAYDVTDGIPDMHTGIIVNGKLFIAMQALDPSWNPGQAYIAVFDVANDTEIDTGKSSLKGVPLPIKNPGKLIYSVANNKIYVQGTGNFLSASNEGGIVSLDPDTYDVQMLVDDNGSAHGKTYNFAIVSPTKGYLVGYHGWQNNNLYSFNPTTGNVNPDAIANLFGKDIGDIEIGPLGKLWVGNRSDFGIVIIDPLTDTAEPDLISTGVLPPLTISFTQ